ncbi:hypothetical protein N9B80_02295 [Methylophilaceae bacterium]|nr:hypothetical protein [Methylophilaceae bacterium]
MFRSILIIKKKSFLILFGFIFFKLFSIIFYLLAENYFNSFYVLPITLIVSEFLFILLIFPKFAISMKHDLCDSQFQKINFKRYLRIYLPYSLVGFQKFYFRGFDVFLIAYFLSPTFTTIYYVNKKLIDFMQSQIISIMNSLFIPLISNIEKSYLLNILFLFTTILGFLFYLLFNKFFITIWMPDNLNFYDLNLTLCISINMLVFMAYTLLRLNLDSKGRFLRVIKIIKNLIFSAVFIFLLFTIVTFDIYLFLILLALLSFISIYSELLNIKFIKLNFKR